MPATIYLVEDSKTLRLMLRTILTLEGYTVKEFVNGEDLLVACADHLPDLILLDVLLPGIDGYEVFRRLRGRSAVPIIMQTTRAEPDEQARGIAAGATDYVVKPFDTADLLRRVRAALAQGESS
jgi:DNA-binding response OmpR family regulator